MSEAKGKIFENENDGMVMEFATGLKEYCKSHNDDCTGCMFYKENDEYDWPFITCSIKNVPERWRV